MRRHVWQPRFYLGRLFALELLACPPIIHESISDHKPAFRGCFLSSIVCATASYRRRLAPAAGDETSKPESATQLTCWPPSLALLPQMGPTAVATGRSGRMTRPDQKGSAAFPSFPPEAVVVESSLRPIPVMTLTPKGTGDHRTACQTCQTRLESHHGLDYKYPQVSLIRWL